MTDSATVSDRGVGGLADREQLVVAGQFGRGPV